jgi:enhancer of polycomb-like protein
LEKNSGQTVVSLKEAKMLLKEDDDLILAVYDYWLNKRLETQQCLIPVVKSESCRGETAAAGQTVNPYIAFRRRTEKMQTRKNRKNEEDSYIRMLKLRRDINRAVMLLDMVKRREKLKKENLNLIADVLEKRYQAADWDGALYQQVQALKPVRVLQPNYPLNSWINAAAGGGLGSPQEVQGGGGALMPLKREKRIYRKRKHHRSGLMRNGGLVAAGFFKSDRGGGLATFSSAVTPDGLSSDDERSSSILGGSGRLSDTEAEEAAIDNPFAFRRKAGVQYLAPLDSLEPDLGRLDALVCDIATSPRHQRFLPAMAALTLGRPAEHLGQCRRRLGRGGRVVIDRIPRRWSQSWAGAAEENGGEVSGGGGGLDDRTGGMAVVRPLTPPQFQMEEWDPYRVRGEAEILAI